MNLTLISLAILVSVLILISIVFASVFLKFGKSITTYIDYKIYDKSKRISTNQFTSDFYDDIYSFILENEYKHRITLSDEARQLLILPLIEYRKLSKLRINFTRDKYQYLEIDYGKELSQWRYSLGDIIETIAKSPARIEGDDDRHTPIPQERTSMSVIKAYSRRFCNIPPFCGER